MLARIGGRRKMGKIVSDGVRSVYKGANTVSEFFGWAFVLSLFLNVIVGGGVLALRNVLRPMWLYLEALLLLSGVTIYLLIQYVHYKRVALTNVQSVVPKIAKNGFAHTVSFRIEVTRDGVTTEERTHAVFSEDVNVLTKYVDQTVLAGYDRKRKRWVII